MILDGGNEFSPRKGAGTVFGKLYMILDNSYIIHTFWILIHHQCSRRTISFTLQFYVVHAGR